MIESNYYQPKAQGKVVEAEVFADFETRGNTIRAGLTREYEDRGEEERQNP